MGGWKEASMPDVVRGVIARAKGNQRIAAAALGLPQRTLCHKLKDLRATGDLGDE